MKLRTQGVSALVCLLVSGCLATDADMAAWEAEESIDSAAQGLDKQGFFPGRGYFVNADSVASDCVVPAAYNGTTNLGLEITPVQAANTGGQEVMFALSKVESSQEVQDKLHISAHAAAKFLVAGGEAKFDFSEQSRVTETSVTLVASLVVRNTSWTVPPGVKLHPEASALLKTNQTARFRERCGDGFLHSYTTGGEFYAIIQINTSSREEKQRIESSVEGNYLTVSGSASFQKDMEKLVKNSSTTVRSYQLGGEGIDSTPCMNISCVAERISAFTAAVARKPLVFAAEVLPYEVLELPSDAVSPLDISLSIDVMKEINKQRNNTRDQLTKFLQVQSKPERYALNAPNATLAQVTAAISTINGNLSNLDNALKACARDPNTCSMPSISAVAVQAPPAKRLPRDIGVLRSYDGPSLFVTGEDYVSGGGATGCKSELAQGISVPDRASLPALTFGPGLVAGPAGDETVSLQAASDPGFYFAAVRNCLGGKGRSPTALGVVNGATTQLKREAASFMVVPGLNGKPNTYSLRRYFTTDAPAADGRNRNPNSYVIRYGNTSVDLVTVDANATSALKDAASWYIETP